MHHFVSLILYRRQPEELFYKKRCVGERRCTKCCELSLFHRNFPINPTQPRMSVVMVTWKWYEYVVIDQSYLPTLEPRRINYLGDDIHVSEFMGNFENHIYKYIKHSHKSKWQDSEFKHSHEVFEPGTILLMIHFAENYTFSPQIDI